MYDFRHDIRLKFDQQIIPGGGGEKAQIWIKAHKKKTSYKNPFNPLFRSQVLETLTTAG